MAPSTAKVTKAWTASYDPALAVSAGQVVRPLREDTEYPGWVWCVDAAGLGGWLPHHVVARDGRIAADFDTKEATVSLGETVEICESRLGWHWVRCANGAEGWLPFSCLAR